MERIFSPASRLFLSLLAIAGWLTLIGQFYLAIANRQTSVAESVVRFFTFFTILTNILVAVACTVLVLKPVSGWGKFFSRVTTLTAVAMSITIVSAVYNIILRPLWHPQGMQRVVDEFLHSVIPVVFVIFWLIFVPKGRLNWGDFFWWLLYPLIYLFVVLIRGALSGYYPYPFLEVGKLGYPKVLVNCAGLTVLFIIVSLLFIAINKFARKRSG